MLRLLKIESIKLFYDKTFWMLLSLYALIFVPLCFMLNKLSNTIFGYNAQQVQLLVEEKASYSIFNHPDVWYNITFLSTWFNTLLVIVIIIAITNDFHYKTLKQNIIDGMSKWEVILAKELVMLTISIFGVVFNIALVLTLGKDVKEVSFFEGSSILLAYFLAMMLYMNIAYFLSFWFKKSGLVLIVLLLYSWVIENIISYYLPENISPFLPIDLVSNMIPNPLKALLDTDNTSTNLSLMNISLCIAYIALFISLNYRMLKKGVAAKE